MDTGAHQGAGAKRNDLRGPAYAERPTIECFLRAGQFPVSCEVPRQTSFRNSPTVSHHREPSRRCGPLRRSRRETRKASSASPCSSSRHCASSILVLTSSPARIDRSRTPPCLRSPPASGGLVAALSGWLALPGALRVLTAGCRSRAIPCARPSLQSPDSSRARGEKTGLESRSSRHSTPNSLCNPVCTSCFSSFPTLLAPLLYPSPSRPPSKTPFTAHRYLPS